MPELVIGKHIPDLYALENCLPNNYLSDSTIAYKGLNADARVLNSHLIPKKKTDLGYGNCGSIASPNTVPNTFLS